MSLTKVDSSVVAFAPPINSVVPQSLEQKLSNIISVTDYGALGNDSSPNDEVFDTIESSNRSAFYLPEGTFYLANTQTLLKQYWGPGRIRFSDGYIQLGLTFTDYPARNDDGHRVIASPADIILRPNGNVTLDGKRLQNVGSPIGELDAVNLQYINSAILPRIQTIEHAADFGYATGTFVPTIQGRVEPGVGTYTRQYGSWVKIGRLVTVRGSIAYTDHTGSGGYQITTNAPVSTGFANIGTLLITGAYAIDYPTADIFAGMNGTVVEFYLKRGDGQYTTYLPMPVPTLGLVTNATINKITLDAATTSTQDHYYVDRTVMIIGGTGAGQSRSITGYKGSLHQATVNTDWTVQPDSTSQYKITSSGGCEFVITYETNQ